LNFKLLAARKLTEKGFSIEKVRAIFSFLRNYVLFDKTETNSKFDRLFTKTDNNNVMNTVEYLRMEGREEGREKDLEQGIAQGREAGREEAQTFFVKNLLKGSEFSVEKIAFMADVTVEFVCKIKSKLNGIR
jgi:flagellar biosynthesis/type III secretory pathway protein FliH